jgi:uncharacterized membrane protein
MQTILYKGGIAIHVLCGTLALITGLIAMIVKKGSKNHNRAGLVFYWSMFMIFVTTTLFFILYPSNLKFQFLMGIGVVSFYPNWSGKRMLAMKKGVNPTWADKLGGWLIGISGLIMIGYGILLTLHPNKNFGGLNILFFVFGSLSLANAYGDLKIYLGYKEAEKMHWFFAHGGKMSGAFAAATTAFCVNIMPRYLPENTPDFVQIMIWIVPGVLIGIIGRMILKKFRVKFAV